MVQIQFSPTSQHGKNLGNLPTPLALAGKFDNSTIQKEMIQKS